MYNVKSIASNVQIPASKVKSPSPRVQRSEFSVQSSASKVKSSGSIVQDLRQSPGYPYAREKRPLRSLLAREKSLSKGNNSSPKKCNEVMGSHYLLTNKDSSATGTVKLEYCSAIRIPIFCSFYQIL